MRDLSDHPAKNGKNFFPVFNLKCILVGRRKDEEKDDEKDILIQNWLWAAIWLVIENNKTANVDSTTYL